MRLTVFTAYYHLHVYALSPRDIHQSSEEEACQKKAENQGWSYICNVSANPRGHFQRKYNNRLANLLVSWYTSKNIGQNRILAKIFFFFSASLLERIWKLFDRTNIQTHTHTHTLSTNIKYQIVLRRKFQRSLTIYIYIFFVSNNF